MSHADVEAEIAEAVDYVVHIERQPGRRFIREVLRLVSYDRRNERFETELLYPVQDRAFVEEKPC
jgi:pilus assembly protein CpaF